MKLSLTFLLIILNFGVFAFATDTLRLEVNQDNIYIENQFIEFYKDTTNQLSFEDVRSGKFDALFSKPDKYSLLEYNTTIWLRFVVTNKSLESGSWILAVLDFTYVDAYMINQSGVTEKVSTGNLLPASKKQIKGGMHELLALKLDSCQTKTIYIKAISSVAVKTQHLFSVYDLPKYYNRMDTVHFIQGIFQGLLFMMLIYNIFLYVVSRKKSYLYYVFYILNLALSILALLQYIRNYFFAETPKMNLYFGFTIFFAFIFYYLLMRAFVDSKTDYPRLDKFLKQLIVINILFTVSIIITQFFNYFVYALFSLIFVAFNMMVLLVIIVSILKKGNNIARIFGVGTAFLFVGILFSVIGRLMGINAEYLLILFQIGIVSQVIIFSMGLGHKYRINEREIQKGQEKLIVQLKENELLQTKVTRELEDKVAERTEQISQQNIALNQLDKFKQSTISMLVHDLKNPLNLLLNSSFDRKVKQATLSMLNIITNILDISKDKTAQVNLYRTPCNLHAILKTAIERTDFLMEQKNIALQTKLQHTHAILVDEEFTVRIFENLLTNAIKYSENNSFIYINTSTENDYTVVEVKDTGRGIEEELKETIFGEYTQVEARKSGAIASTGLGLTFCKMATEKQNGRIELWSKPNLGTSFFVYLENATLHEEQAELAANTEPDNATLTQDEMLLLQETMETLSNTEIYEISTILDLLRPVKTKSPNIQLWCNKVKTAALTANQILYNKLTNNAI